MIDTQEQALAGHGDGREPYKPALPAERPAHTPLPWRLGGIGVIDSTKGSHVVDMGQPPHAPFAVCYGNNAEVNRSNAQFIVTACNNYEALKQTLIGISGGLAMAQVAHPYALKSILTAIVSQVDTALANAKALEGL